MAGAKRRKHYCLHYLRFYGLLCFLLGSLFFVIQLLLRIAYGNCDTSIWLTCVTSYIPCILVFLILLSYTARFNRMIDQQEEMFGIQFSDECASPVSRNGLTFLSKDWLIHAGSAAFYKDYIANISYGIKQGEIEVGYRLQIRTVDGKLWHLTIGERFNCVKIRSWWKDSQEKREEIYEL